MGARDKIISSLRSEDDEMVYLAAAMIEALLPRDQWESTLIEGFSTVNGIKIHYFRWRWEIIDNHIEVFPTLYWSVPGTLFVKDPTKLLKLVPNGGKKRKNT